MTQWAIPPLLFIHSILILQLPPARGARSNNNKPRLRQNYFLLGSVGVGHKLLIEKENNKKKKGLKEVWHDRGVMIGATGSRRATMKLNDSAAILFQSFCFFLLLFNAVAPVPSVIWFSFDSASYLPPPHLSLHLGMCCFVSQRHEALLYQKNDQIFSSLKWVNKVTIYQTQ